MIKSTKFLTLLLMSVYMLTSCNFGKSQSAEEQNNTVAGEEENDNSNLQKAPQFEVTTIDGQKISLDNSVADNKPMLIYFTASWCPMCAQNWPAIAEVYSEYKDRVNFVAISIDPTDDNEVMTKLAEEKDLDFPLVKGSPQVMLEFGVDSQATTVGVNEEGYIEFQKNKVVLTADEYRDLIEQLLKK